MQVKLLRALQEKEVRRVGENRSRPVEDILPLARVFLGDLAKRMRRNVSGFTPRAADQLLRHEWPGNVREVQNAIEHAVALATGNRIDVDDLPEELRTAPPRPRPRGRTQPLEDIEREYILAAVESAGGNRTRAAAELMGADEKVGALLPHVLTTERPQDPEEVLRSHRARLRTERHCV